jgi:predicted small lipoprotein YifL
MQGVRFAIMLLVLLQGCGLKGPLYLPTEQQKRDMAQRERLLKEREARRQGTALPQAAPPAETEPTPRQSDSDLLPDVAPPPIGEPPQMDPAAPPPQ